MLYVVKFKNEMTQHLVSLAISFNEQPYNPSDVLTQAVSMLRNVAGETAILYTLVSVEEV